MKIVEYWRDCEACKVIVLGLSVLVVSGLLLFSNPWDDEPMQAAGLPTLILRSNVEDLKGNSIHNGIVTVQLRTDGSRTMSISWFDENDKLHARTLSTDDIVFIHLENGAFQMRLQN